MTTAKNSTTLLSSLALAALVVCGSIGVVFLLTGVVTANGDGQDPAERCYELALPAGAVASGEGGILGYTISYFPLSLECQFKAEVGGTISVQISDWAPTWQTYGGLALVAGSGAWFAASRVASSRNMDW